MLYQEERQQIVDLGRNLYERGYAYGSSGNISLKVATGYLVTPTNFSMGKLTPPAITFLDEAWNHIAGDPPTKEVPMHRAFFEANPDTRAVVHLHSTYATALSCVFTENSWDLPHLTPYSVMRLGAEIGVIPYVKPGDPALASEISKVAGSATAVLMRNHGIATTGTSLAAAAFAAEEFEEAAKLHLLLHNRVTSPLTDSQVAELSRL